MNFVQLDITAIKQSDSQNNAYVLLLNEADGERQLPIVIGWCEARSIAVALEDNEKLDRPLTHDLFKTLGDNFNIIVEKIVIHTLIEGIFHSSFYCKNGITNEIVAIDSRTSDAIALAIRFNSPIFTYESVLEKAGIIIKAGGEKVKKESNKSKKVDLNKMSIKQIKNAIEVAVKNENYELAAQLRDKLTEKNE